VQSSLISATVLKLGGTTSVVQSGEESTPAAKEFKLGVESLAQQCLLHQPPLPIELEHAIELTEDVVMPLAPQFATSSFLVLQGMGAEVIAKAIQASGLVQTALTLDQVESLFNRLVAVNEGRPPSQEPLPTDKRLFASVLILWEFMHHLRFTQVTLQTSRDGPS
jgi:exopolyphosphatase/pppGpp-phosphohydrolase